jgi:DNA-binding NarL/FixJ family response regulator
VSGDEDASRREAEHRSSLRDGAEQVAEIGSWEVSHETGELVWSSNLYRLFGLQPGEITPTMDYVLGVTHEDDRERIARVIAYLGREGHLEPVEYRILRPDGVMRRLRSTITSTRTPDGLSSSLAGVVEDVTDEIGADHKIAAHIAVSDALNEWESFETGAPRLLSVLAQALEFSAATLWVPDGDVLVARAVWTSAAHDAADFARVTRAQRLRRGTCLPGVVWDLGHAVHVVDVQVHSPYSRRDAAARAGLHGAVALPLAHADEVLAVMELNSREVVRQSPLFMLSLRAVGSELGQFLAHRRGELDLTTLTPRQVEVMQLAAQGYSGREIAERLFISATTVKSHFESIYDRLGVSDRASAVAEAMRCGLIG